MSEIRVHKSRTVDRLRKKFKKKSTFEYYSARDHPRVRIQMYNIAINVNIGYETNRNIKTRYTTEQSRHRNKIEKTFLRDSNISLSENNQ